MRIPLFRRLLREDFRDQPWIDKLLVVLNSFMDTVVRGLQKGITFEENIQAQIRTIDFSTNANYVTSKSFTQIAFPNELPVRPKGIFLMQIFEKSNGALVKDSVSLAWTENSNVIFINYVSGLENSKTYTMRVLVV